MRVLLDAVQPELDKEAKEISQYTLQVRRYTPNVHIASRQEKGTGQGKSPATLFCSIQTSRIH